MVASNNSKSPGAPGAAAPDRTVVVSVPQPRVTLVRRALRERRALRQAQASQVVLSRRWVAAAAASSSWCSSERLQLEELRRSMIARVQAAKKASSPSATITGSLPPPACSAATPTGEAFPAASAGRQAVAAATAAASTDVESYFVALLAERGRPSTSRTSMAAGYLKPPTAKQVEDYQQQPFMSDLARRGDIAGLRKAVEEGRGMDASNKFGESVVHVACRRGNLDVLRFLVENGGDLTACDDLGRFPLHEVCWAAQPRFDIVRVFLEEERRANSRRRADGYASSASNMSSGSGSSNTTSSSTSDGGGRTSSDGGGDSSSTGSTGTSSSGYSDVPSAGGGGFDGDLNMLLVTDKRGCSPLRYVKKESWPLWRRFLDEVVDEYWPSVSSPPQAAGL